MKPGKVTVVGGGLAGGLISIMLARSGWRVTLLERRADPRETRLRSTRTINLALSTRGRTALASVGLEDRVLSKSVAMHGDRCTASASKSASFPTAAANNAIYSIRRDLLNQILIEEASRRRVEIPSAPAVSTSAAVRSRGLRHWRRLGLPRERPHHRSGWSLVLRP